MNRLGMLVDISHVSPDTMADVLRVSQAPVIASHSGAYAIAPSPRNVPDESCEVEKNGGVVMVNFYSGFVVPEAARPRPTPAGLCGPSTPNRATMPGRMRPGPKQYKLPRGTIADVADHIDHIVKVAGIDHAGIGSDFDGITSWPVGLDDVSCFPRLTEELLRRGHTEADVHKILGRNVLRALREAGVGRRATPKDHGARGRSAQAPQGLVGSLCSLQRLEILDHVHPLVVTELVAEGMAAVAEAEVRGVEDETGLVRRRSGEGGAATVSNFQPTWTWS